MHATLNQLFNEVMKMRRGSFYKKFGHLKKTTYRLYLRFYNCKPLEKGKGCKQIANVIIVFLLNTALLGCSGYFFAIKYLMFNFTKCLLAAETCALINCRGCSGNLLICLVQDSNQVSFIRTFLG